MLLMSSKPGSASTPVSAGSTMVSPTLVSADVLDRRDEEADFARGELGDFDGLGGEHAHGFHVEDAAVATSA